jgi:hypothetical protein
VFADFPNFRPIPNGAATQLGFSGPPGEGPIIITIDAELEPD